MNCTVCEQDVEIRHTRTYTHNGWYPLQRKAAIYVLVSQLGGHVVFALCPDHAAEKFQDYVDWAECNGYEIDQADCEVDSYTLIRDGVAGLLSIDKLMKNTPTTSYEIGRLYNTYPPNVTRARYVAELFCRMTRDLELPDSADFIGPGLTNPWRIEYTPHGWGRDGHLTFRVRAGHAGAIVLCAIKTHQAVFIAPEMEPVEIWDELNGLHVDWCSARRTWRRKPSSAPYGLISVGEFGRKVWAARNLFRGRKV